MDKDIQKASEKGKDALVPKNSFKGYTIEELRYHRALVALQKEFCKSKILHNIDNIRNPNKDNENGKISKLARIGSIASKLLSGLNYLDYAMMGVSLFGVGKKAYNLFKRKRK